MIKYKTNTNFIKYDIEKIKEAVDYISSVFSRGIDIVQDDVDKLVEKIDIIKNSRSIKKEESIEERVETEDEALEYFGKNFVQEYLDLLKYCDENNLTPCIHGTSMKSAREIIDEGLNYRSPDITSTAVPMGLEDLLKFSTLLNWPHRQYKGLVFLGIPKESEGKFWRKINEKMEEGSLESKYAYNYCVPSEFILGVLDIEGKNIIKNSKFTLEHNYDKYITDRELHFGKINKSINGAEIDDADFVEAEEESCWGHADYQLEEIDVEEDMFKNFEDMLGSLNALKNYYYNNEYRKEKELKHIEELIKNYLDKMVSNKEKLKNKTIEEYNKKNIGEESYFIKDYNEKTVEDFRDESEWLDW